MLMKVILNNESWFVGERGWKQTGLLFNHETKGTHHFKIITGSVQFIDLVGKEVAMPIHNVLCFILDTKY